MKKSAIMMAAVCCMAVLFTGCGQKLGEEFTEEVNTLEGAVLSIPEESVSAQGVAYELANNTEQSINYDRGFSIQKEKDGKWYQLEGEAIPVTMELLWVEPGNTDTGETIWGDAYGKLGKGRYRLVKNVANEEEGYYLAAEFTIE